VDYKLELKIKTAVEFEAKGKFLHAVQIYQTLINDYPEICEPYINLADLYQAKGQNESAEKLLKIILTKQPDNHEAVLYYAQFLMQNNEWDRAVVKLLEVSLDESFLSYLIGYCYYILGDYELARVHFLQFIISEADPELIHEVYFLLAKIELDLKQYESALKFAKKAKVMYNNHWELYLIIAKIYFHLKMYTHSCDSILKGIKLNADETILFEWAGKIHLKLDNYVKAKKYFEKHIDLKDSITSSDYFYLADACLKTGELNKALDFFNTAIKLDPKNHSALNGKEKANNLIKNKLASDV